MPLNCSICSAALNLRFRQDKINHPEEYISNWDEYTEQHKNGLIKHWNKEIYNLIIPGLRPTPAAVQRSLTALQPI